MHCEFLPPYSPDFNLIKLTFSTMKYNLHQNRDYMRLAMTLLSDQEIYVTLLKALYFITPEDSFAWYLHCGDV
ncbi:hypothetical protein BS17DRAFT_715585 [Gyrodon lividus]|nr:hypothetical protein BS17DRAFT_715585 [Gyrodon lividus]